MIVLVGLIILSPIFILVTIGLYFANQGKPFFFQERPGQFKKPFYIIKFKTMTDEKDAEGNLLPDNLRITKFGRWVRKLSIDELPQLINVLKGEMSLVGPRPLLFKYMPLYTAEQLRRHEVRPGITGWAQVNGFRGETETLDKMEQRVNYDLDYLRSWSLWMDLKIIMLTVSLVLKRKNAY